jgi:hypothetical protein
MGFLSVLSMAHKWIAERVEPGDCVIDATAGTGVDTLALAELAGGKGIVYAFDIQQEALDRTQERIAASRLVSGGDAQPGDDAKRSANANHGKHGADAGDQMIADSGKHSADSGEQMIADSRKRSADSGEQMIADSGKHSADSGEQLIADSGKRGADSGEQLIAGKDTGWLNNRNPQPIAISRLAEVRLVLGSHADMADLVEPAVAGRVAAVMFNLGYLPGGGDQSVITEPSSTLAALDASLSLLRKGGIITCVLYPGHPGGAEEAAAVERYAAALPQKLAQAVIYRQPQRSQAPYLVAIEKR